MHASAVLLSIFDATFLLILAEDFCHYTSTLLDVSFTTYVSYFFLLWELLMCVSVMDYCGTFHVAQGQMLLPRPRSLRLCIHSLIFGLTCPPKLNGGPLQETN